MNALINKTLNYISYTGKYLTNLLMYDFSWMKYIIFGIIVFILFELVIGWYIPKPCKKVQKK